MHDRPGEWENGHPLSLQGELVVRTSASLPGAPGQNDTCAELDDLILAAVDDPELETFPPLVGSDHRVTAKDDGALGRAKRANIRPAASPNEASPARDSSVTTTSACQETGVTSP